VTLALERVSIHAGGRVLVRELSCAIGPGEALTLMGPSGSGKSSLLAYCCGALPAGLRGEGRVLVDGVDVTKRPPHRRGIGILFQDDLLFPHMSVGDNLLFGLHPSVRGRVSRRAAVNEALASAELGGLGGRDPASLSGGQRARVALLRVLLSRPRVLFLDEPFSRLDAALRERFREWVFTRAAEAGLPLLLVTHDAADARGDVLRLPETDQISAAAGSW
jgi:putative thiamine transport system ATP-binding protein